MTREVLCLALIACGTQSIPTRPGPVEEDIVTDDLAIERARVSTQPNPAIVAELTECRDVEKDLKREVKALKNSCYRPPAAKLAVTRTPCQPGWACYDPTEAGPLLAALLRLEAIDKCEREKRGQ